MDVNGFNEQLLEVLNKISSVVWGPAMLILLLGTGLYYTVRLRGLAFTKLLRAFKEIFKGDGDGEGDVSTYGALSTALAATIGTGSIVGVATALTVGGPGALFWMWVSALLGMSTKYAEGFLAIKYRSFDEHGQVAGGPMYYIENGLGKKFRWLAKAFAFFGMFTALLGSGTFPQVNAITQATNTAFNFPVWAVGIIITIGAAVVIIGGIKSIANFASLVVPFMAALYVIGSLIILGVNHEHIGEAFNQIFTYAFDSYSMAGGAAGGIIILASQGLQLGVARGVYTNEAGLGSSPIVMAAAKSSDTVKQGLVALTSVFITTIIVCTMTGLVILTSGLLGTPGLDGAALSNAVYGQSLPYEAGKYIVTLGLIFFSFTTIVGWSYYGERCVVYLTDSLKYINVYKAFYILAIAVAPYLELRAIWTLADITNALMAIPNLIGLLFLSPIVISETKAYFEREKYLQGKQ